LDELTSGAEFIEVQSRMFKETSSEAHSPMGLLISPGVYTWHFRVITQSGEDPSYIASKAIC
jgi:hypothetical protein